MATRGRGRVGAATAASGGRGRGAAKRPRDESEAPSPAPVAGVSASASGAAVDSGLRAALMDLLRRNPDGITTDEVDRSGIGESSAVMAALNAALSERSVGVFMKKDAAGKQQHVVRLISGETQLADLSPEESLVFQEISKAGNVGIWKKTLKSATGLSEGEIKKVLKHLLTINLVKEVKSVVHKAKKIYMLASLEPSTEVTGGLWYTEHQEMDHEFIEGIRQHVLNELGKGPKTCRDLKEIAGSVHGTAAAWSHTDECLGLSEFRSILTTLKYDGFVEETRPVPGSRYASEGDPTFRVVTKSTGQNPLTTVPCGQCPVFNKCKPGGVISPQNCVYFDAFLDF